MKNLQVLKDVLQLPSPLQKVEFSEWGNFTNEIYFKRDDLIHPYISGNKWRKFEGHLIKYNNGHYSGILTFGGAFSNHIIAVAAALQLLKIPCVGIIRGEIEHQNPALKFALECGMVLIPISRSAYKNKNISEILPLYPDLDLENYMIVPEGGGGEEGLIGCQEILNEIDLDFDLIVTACGTGTTLAGIVKSLATNQKAIGISVLKGEDTITPMVKNVNPLSSFEVITGYHFGGYARKTDELIAFAQKFTFETRIPLDFVYTSKMVYAFHDLLLKGKLAEYQKVVLLHTGGLKNAAIT